MPRVRNDDDKSSVRESDRTATTQEDEKRPAVEPLAARLRKPLLSSYAFFWLILLLAVVLCAGSLYRRLAVEWSHRSLAIVVDYRDVVLLSRQSGTPPASIYQEMHERGVRGILVSELTGKDLSGGMAPVVFGPLASFDPSYRTSLDVPLDRAALLIDSSDPILAQLQQVLDIRFPGYLRNLRGGQTLFVLPIAFDESAESGIMPDFAGLRFAQSVESAIVYRPAPAQGVDGERTAASLAWLLERYDRISAVLPLGQMIAGYPQLAPTVKVLKESAVSVAQAEFVRQIGAGALFAAMNPDILPLHSLVREELISRRMTREQVVERMVRAVHERSIRLVLMRPYDLYSVGKLPFFLEDLEKIHDALRTRGYTFNWPQHIPLFGPTLFAALGLSLVFAMMARSYAGRYSGAVRERVTLLEVAVFAGFSLLLAILLWKVSLVSRLLGGVTAALVATEATIWALDRYHKPFDGLIAGLLIIMAGGLSIAAFYGSTSAMLRLAPFSGVKLTLLLPPILVLVNDLKRRVHPESFSDIMRRPPLWGELVLVGVLLMGALLLTVRSDNFAFVPGWEIRFRDFLERTLWVRPRTKEFLVGYPCLIIYYSLVRGNIAERYREVFRIGASLAYASAINTFCHFHTLLPLTVVRVVNGWWLGIVVGFVMLVAIDYVGGPIWRRGGRELFR